jgi:hypothetical protein
MYRRRRRVWRVWAKVLAQEAGITELALTSGDPSDLEALGALAGSD